jgi:hypothetical protein
VLCCFVIFQSGERDFAASGSSRGRIDSKAVESASLLGFDGRQQSVRFSQVTRLDCFLRFGS